MLSLVQESLAVAYALILFGGVVYLFLAFGGLPALVRYVVQPAGGGHAAANQEHYLRKELRNLLRSRPDVAEFLGAGARAGIWYWDLENPEIEWLSPNFWKLLGVDPAEKMHESGEWQNLIHPDDLEKTLTNLRGHCADPSYPYDQIVRYRHADGSTVLVRCRGMAIRDESGKPIRMLGAHTDLTELTESSEEFASVAIAVAM